MQGTLLWRCGRRGFPVVGVASLGLVDIVTWRNATQTAYLAHGLHWGQWLF